MKLLEYFCDDKINIVSQMSNGPSGKTLFGHKLEIPFDKSGGSKARSKHLTISETATTATSGKAGDAKNSSTSALSSSSSSKTSNTKTSDAKISTTATSTTTSNSKTSDAKINTATASNTKTSDAKVSESDISISRGSNASVRSNSMDSALSAPIKPHTGSDGRWEAIQLAAARESPLGLGHFRLLKRLGYGDIGSVYLVELRGTNTFFAMKVMDKVSIASRNKLIRAQTEREILGLLDHPFLPTLYSYFETDKFYCLVMEFCSGGNLHSLRQKQPNKYFNEYAARPQIAVLIIASRGSKNRSCCSLRTPTGAKARQCD
ncbi:hypothetical protein ACLOJK_010802 [Asimina triloba]